MRAKQTYMYDTAVIPNSDLQKKNVIPFQTYEMIDFSVN
jgi:hypothetical protein